MRRPSRLAVALLGAALLSTACGSRLPGDQLTLARAQVGGGQVLTDPNNGASGVTEPGATPLAGAIPTAQASTAGAPTGTATAAPGTTPRTRNGATAGTSGTAGTAGTGNAAAVDTRRAPPGGNGGATDNGITADTITVSNVSDISGAVPGLFEDAQLAAKAYVAYFAAKEGTIYGRKLSLIALDSRLDAGANRSASIQACEQSFASVGSVSAFDQGGAPVIRDCGIPDLRGLSTTNPMKAVPNAFPMNAAGTGGARALAMFGWAAEQFPAAIKKAAYIYIDGEVTRTLAQEDMEGTTAILGYDWIYQPAIGITETNYGPIVQQLKSRGVNYISFAGAYQQAAALAQEFQRQNYKPQVFQPTVTAYSQDFLKQAGSAAEKMYVAVVPTLNEEISASKELQTYAQWLNQVQPGATPTGIGQYAWSAVALFVEQMKALGPKPTRTALLAELPKIHNWTGNGLFPGQDVGGRKLSSCTKVVQVQNGKFVRVVPLEVNSNRCKDLIYDTKTKKAEKGFPQ